MSSAFGYSEGMTDADEARDKVKNLGFNLIKQIWLLGAIYL